MKKFNVVIILLILTLKSSFANTYSPDPKMFVDELVNDAISKLSDKDKDNIIEDLDGFSVFLFSEIYGQ